MITAGTVGFADILCMYQHESLHAQGNRQFSLPIKADIFDFESNHVIEIT